MKLQSLATAPQLTKIVLDDEETVAEYDEPIEFYCYDRQPIASFIRFANNTEQNLEELFNFCQDLILDEKGNKIMVDDNVLPSKLMMRCVNKVIEQLGK